MTTSPPVPRTRWHLFPRRPHAVHVVGVLPARHPHDPTTGRPRLTLVRGTVRRPVPHTRLTTQRTTLASQHPESAA